MTADEAGPTSYEHMHRSLPATYAAVRRECRAARPLLRITTSLEFDSHGRLRRRNRVLPIVHRDLVAPAAREPLYVGRASHDLGIVGVGELVKIVAERHDQGLSTGIDRSKLSCKDE